MIPSAKCPQCDYPVEDAYHVIKCPNPAAITVWEDSLKKLFNWMDDTKTGPELRDVIIDSLCQWKQPINSPTTANITPSLQQLLQEQADIGWYNFLDGFLSTGWAETQVRYYVGICSQRSS